MFRAPSVRAASVRCSAAFVPRGRTRRYVGGDVEKAARYYNVELSRFIDRFTRTAEPVLMAAIGIVVGGIVVLLYMPIFELAGSLQ